MNLHRIHGASVLSPLRPGHDYRPCLDELSGLGFDLVRVFCGALPWAGQELRHVYERLPQFLTEARQRGLNVYEAYHTEAGTGYDLNAHTRELEAINADRDNVLREAANEADHPTQGGRLSPERCREIVSMMASPVAGYGATIEDDESDKYAGGAFVSVHRDRSRDKWNCVRRVREVEASSERNKKPAFDQEPIGADEQSIQGKRESDPAIFFTQAVLARIFEVGSILHSTDGLHANRFQPNQRRCAEAFITGHRIWPYDSPRLTYKNTGWADSPVKDAWFQDEGGTVCRVYSGVTGNDGLTCALGLTGDPRIEWQNGWTPREVIGQMSGVTVWRIER
jgi:hypothetical protein